MAEADLLSVLLEHDAINWQRGEEEGILINKTNHDIWTTEEQIRTDLEEGNVVYKEGIGLVQLGQKTRSGKQVELPYTPKVGRTRIRETQPPPEFQLREAAKIYSSLMDLNQAAEDPHPPGVRFNESRIPIKQTGPSRPKIKIKRFTPYFPMTNFSLDSMEPGLQKQILTNQRNLEIRQDGVYKAYERGEISGPVMNERMRALENHSNYMSKRAFLIDQNTQSARLDFFKSTREQFKTTGKG